MGHVAQQKASKEKQDCIPVGCVLPARRPYLPCPGGCTWSGGRGVPGLGGCLVWGVHLVLGGVPGPKEVYVVPGCGVPDPGGCTWSQGGTWSGTPPVNRITHTCKNITLPQLHCGR